jgi:hypothetical protein
MAIGLSFGRGAGLRSPGKGFSLFTLFLAALAGLIAASPIGSTIYVIGAISVIGIPIAMMVAVLPTAMVAVVITGLVRRLLPVEGAVGMIAAALFAGAIMVIVPVLHNAEVDAKYRALVQGDIVRASDGRNTRFPGGGIFGIAVNKSYTPDCRDLCATLLMDRRVDAVIIARRAKDAVEPDFSAQGRMHRLVRSATCEHKEVRLNVRDMREERAGTVGGRLTGMMKRGFCIETTQASLDQADAVANIITSGQWPDPKTISPIDSDMSVSRASYYMRGENGFRETWRQTKVRYSRLGPVLAHTFGGGAQLQVHSQWWRNRVNGELKLRLTDGDFLRNVLGVPLPQSIR